MLRNGPIFEKSLRLYIVALLKCAVFSAFDSAMIANMQNTEQDQAGKFPAAKEAGKANAANPVPTPSISPDMQNNAVMMAMSGGVDSSVAALLLSREGYNVVGVTMKLFEETDLAGGQRSSCCSIDDVEDARAVCRRLGIRHFTFNLKDAFKSNVIDRFCDAYLNGRTPNPCIDCNRYLKFDALQRRRRELGLAFVATGHYARRRYDEASGCWQLLRARDISKDQSYVLYSITQEQLAHALFPLGNLTKDEVRDIARDAGFANAEKSESQDICFIPDGNYIDFIERYIERNTNSAADKHAFQSGPIADREGKILGVHNGLARYTIGQRKGIRLAAPEPLYVFSKNIDRNELIVGTADEVLVNGVIADDINLISATHIDATQTVQVKTHYRQSPLSAKAEQIGEDELKITFAEPQRAAAPGQAAVLYDGDKVLGGGTISGCF